jgi:hypothetical protein
MIDIVKPPAKDKLESFKRWQNNFTAQMIGLSPYSKTIKINSLGETMDIDDIVNVVIEKTAEAVTHKNEEDCQIELSNLHVWAINRLQGYDENGVKGEVPQ